MNFKKVTAVLLSTAALAASPSVPLFYSAVQNATITASARFYAPDTYITDIWRNSVGYSLYSTDYGTVYASVIGTSPYMKELTLPESVVYQGVSYPVQIIAEDAFQYSNIQTVTVNTESFTVKAGAFHDSAIQSFVFNGKIITIMEEAFRESALNSIRFGSSTESISLLEKCFWKTASLSDVLFDNPDVFLYMEKFVFADSAVCNITLPASVTEIPVGCFESCSNLRNLVLPSTVTAFRYYAFKNAVLPSSLVIPAGLTTIEPDALYCVRNIAAYFVDYSNPVFRARDGVLYAWNSDTKEYTLYSYPAEKKNETFVCEGTAALRGSIGYNPYLKTLDISKTRFSSNLDFPCLTSLEYLIVPDEDYAMPEKNFLNKYDSLFCTTQVHCVNDEEVLSYSATGEPYLDGRIGSYVKPAFELYSADSYMRYYVDQMADYVVRTELNDSMTKIEKAVRLHQWICERVIYDPDVMLYEWKKENLSVTDEKLNSQKNHVDASVFLHQKEDGKYYTVCEGYARCYKLLMDKAKIPTEVVSGKNRYNEKLSGHAWNLVNLDGTWYHVDVTWDDMDYVFDPYRNYNGIVPDSDLLPFSENTDRYKNFLASDYLFGRDGHDNYAWASEQEPERNWLYGAAADSTLYMRGDINFDFKYDAIDLTRIQKHLIRQQPFEFLDEWKRADIDNDGSVDVFDLTFMRIYMNKYRNVWSPASWRYSLMEK